MTLRYNGRTISELEVELKDLQDLIRQPETTEEEVIVLKKRMEELQEQIAFVIQEWLDISKQRLASSST